MRPGDLREKVRFTEPIRTKEADANITQTEKPYLETFASVNPMRAVRGLEASKLILVQPYEVVIRDRRDKQITVDMAMWHGDKKYLIKEVTDWNVKNSFVKLIVVRE